MTRILAVVAALAALVLPLVPQAQDKGMSEKDCRNVNFPASEERLIRACDASYALCANPPPAWQQIRQVTQVCELIKRESQLQAAKPGLSGRLLERSIASAPNPAVQAAAQTPVTAPTPLSGALPGSASPFAANSGIADGAILAATNESSAAQCLERCRSTAGCNGFQFSGGTYATPRQPNLPGGNCILFSGASRLRPQEGLTACLMPCDGSSRSPGITLRPIDPDARVAGPGRVLPGRAEPAAPAPPPAAYVGPSGSIKSFVATPLPAPTPPASAQPVSAPMLTGYAIAVGPLTPIGSGTYGTVTAQCPAGKVALSAGFRALPINAEPQYGVEVRTAVPENSVARVVVRNAFAFGHIQVEPYAICVDPLPGMRAIRQGFVARSDQQLDSAVVSCGPNERLIGGGFIGAGETHPVVAAPVRHSSGAQGYVVAGAKTSPTALSAATTTVEIIALCAPATAVPDWEIVTGAWQTINRRASASMMLDCPPGKRLLAGGAMHAAYVWREPVARDPNAPVVFVPAPTFSDFNPLAQLSNMNFPGDTRLPNGQPLAGGGLRAMVSNRDIGWAVVNTGLSSACATVR